MKDNQAGALCVFEVPKKTQAGLVYRKWINAKKKDRNVLWMAFVFVLLRVPTIKKGEFIKVAKLKK